MRNRSEGQGRRVVGGICLVVVLLTALSVYYGSSGVETQSPASRAESDAELYLAANSDDKEPKINGDSGEVTMAENEGEVGGDSGGGEVQEQSEEQPSKDGGGTRSEEGEREEEPQMQLHSAALSLDVSSFRNAKEDEVDSGELPEQGFEVCPAEDADLIPCHSRELQKKMKLHLSMTLMEHYERHCPTPELRLKCLVPPPWDYKIPIRWPQSRDVVWRANIPHTLLAHEKASQNWMVEQGDTLRFPGGGTHFPHGADAYIRGLATMLGFEDEDLSGGGRIRTVLDVGCGVASFGAYLLNYNILAMSLAPNDVHANQIQFAMERGIPATLGVIGTKRLPFPSMAFELAHCSRCRIDWAQRGGTLLLEVDRMLRPGGYFAWSSPPAYRDDEEDRKIWKEMTDLVTKMCWTIAAKEGQTVIWQKPKYNDCYNNRAAGVSPPLCDKQDPDAVVGVEMEACITPMPDGDHQWTPLSRWPRRLTRAPQRLHLVGASAADFAQDTEAWGKRVEAYWAALEGQVAPHSIRNVLDMHAGLGSFAAALAQSERPLWVLNAVNPTAGRPNTLPIIYDRGLIGTTVDWCEGFSTYPRTFDLVHGAGVLSDALQRCSVEQVLLEVDRVLRPHGIVILRDTPAAIAKAKALCKALRWDNWIEEREPEADDLSDGDERVLYIKKRFWENPHPRPSESNDVD